MPEQPGYSNEVILPVIRAIHPDIKVERLSYHDLCDEINRLIVSDFNLLINTLYRLDVSETKIKAALVDEFNKDAAELIADLMLERQLEKLKTRNLFNRNDDIPDEEKW